MLNVKQSEVCMKSIYCLFFPLASATIELFLIGRIIRWLQSSPVQQSILLAEIIWRQKASCRLPARLVRQCVCWNDCVEISLLQSSEYYPPSYCGRQADVDHKWFQKISTKTLHQNLLGQTHSKTYGVTQSCWQIVLWGWKITCRIVWTRWGVSTRPIGFVCLGRGRVCHSFYQVFGM